MRPAFLSERMPLYIGVSLIVVAAFNLMNLILMALHSRGKLAPKSKKPAASPAPAAASPAPAAPAAPAPAPASAPAESVSAAPEAEPPKPAEPPEAAPSTIFEELQRYAEQDKKNGGV